MTEPWWVSVIKSVIIINLVLAVFAYMTLAERKVMGRMQLRYGPNRAGPFGLLQPIADMVKLIRKESFFPGSAVDVLYILSPFVAAFTALSTFAVIPFGPGWEIFGTQVDGQIADVPIALILIFAIGSIGIYGFIVGGWASDSKYALLGSMRTCAQLVSYEVSLALSVLGVVIMAQSLSLTEIVFAQNDWWYVFPQFVGFVVFLFAGTAETARAPFDLPEAEQELVAGYHTEYGGMRFGLFTMAEYINLITLSALAVTLFLGGWHFPVLEGLGPLWFVLKLFVLLFVFIWMRTTLPRLRYDQLMRFGWKILLPVATINAVVTAILVVWLCNADRDRQGLRRHLPADLQQADHPGVPGVQAARVPALPRPPPPARARERAGEVRRLLALRRGVPGRLHPRRPGREHPRQPRLGRRALCAHLRDQHEPLHLLRLLRARLPVRRDHARQRVRDLRVLARRPDLHQGHAARGADEEGSRRRPRALRHAHPGLQVLLLMGNVLVWAIWILAAAGCLGSGLAVITFTNPFFSALALIGNLGSLAVLFLLASAEFLAAAQVLVYAGAVMVMFLFVIAYLGDRTAGPLQGGPSWISVAAIVAAAALLVEIVVVIGLKAGGALTDEATVEDSFGSPAEIGRLFLTDHLLAFEITSIVLLIAAVGGVVLGTHSKAEDEEELARARA